MLSLLDTFLASARDISNTIIGTESVTLSGGVVLTGVWSSTGIGNSMEDGGFQMDISTTVIVPASSTVTKALIGQRCTYNGAKLRVRFVEIGTNETTVMFEDETKSLSS